MDISHELEQDHTKIRTRNYIHLALRLVTGFLLTHKGFFFIRESKYLEDLIKKTAFSGQLSFFVSYVPWAHFLGGAFIILGLLTRVAVVIQIPIVIAAIYYAFSPALGIKAADTIMSVALLPLLVYILIKGAGKISMDYYLRKHVL